MPSRITPRAHRAISIAIIALGGVLMAGKIYADSEPGAIPLLLVVLGIAWHALARRRIRSRKP